MTITEVEVSLVPYVVWHHDKLAGCFLATSEEEAERNVYRMHAEYVSRELKAGGAPSTVRHWSWNKLSNVLDEKAALEKKIITLEEEISYAQVARDNALAQRDETMERSKQKGQTMGKTVAEGINKLARFNILTDEELLFLKAMHDDGDRIYRSNESRIGDLHRQLVFGMIAARELDK